MNEYHLISLLFHKFSIFYIDPVHTLNHMAIALLDSKYQIIPGYDVVLDLDVQLDVKRWKCIGEPAFRDFRLFMLNGELYLHINADTVIVTKIKLRAKGFGSVEEGQVEVENDGEQQYKLENLYGGNQLEVTLLHQFNSIWGGGREKSRWKNWDKNYALFSLPNRRIYAEMSIYPDHKVMEIIPDEYDLQPQDRYLKKRIRRNFRIDHIMQRRIKALTDTTSSTPVLPSFFTADEHWFPGKRNPFKEFAHGGACCVSFSLDNMAAYRHPKWEGIYSLLVGVGHNKIHVRNSKNLVQSSIAWCNLGRSP